MINCFAKEYDMPIKHNVTVKPVSESEFHLLDYKIMEIVFSIHKDLGNFCDEKIYQKAHLLNSGVAFKISAVTKNGSFYEQHLRKFIGHTPLKAIQWINFNRNKVVFKTIRQ